MASIDKVLQMIQDNDVKFVDLRFTDMKGKEQHVSIPARAVDEDWFEEGQPFDGSSMAGWKGIEASDMILIADPESARLDPFREESTLILTCDATDPATGKGYNRDPRSIAKRAEAYLKSTGIGDMAFFGPEPEFHIFDSIVTRSLRSVRMKPVGLQRSITNRVISVIVRVIKAATSRCLRLTLSKTCALRCAF